MAASEETAAKACQKCVSEGIPTETVHVVESEKGQTVCLPRQFRLNTSEVVIHQFGEAVILAPRSSMWHLFLEGLTDSADTASENGHNQGICAESAFL